MDAQLPTIEILGVPVAALDDKGALEAIERLGEAPEPSLIAFVNAHSLNVARSNPAYRGVLLGADLVLNDGIGLALAARINRRRFPANLNGSDLSPRILGLAAGRGWPVYLLGARPGVAAAAAERLQASIPGLRVAGTRDGYFPAAETDAVVTAIRDSGAKVLLVAMGNPRQELWLAEHLADTGASLGAGVGAFFDFTTQTVRRAPAWMNRLGIEWVWRLIQEPGRMWRRYIVGNPLFLGRVIAERLRNRR